MDQPSCRICLLVSAALAAACGGGERGVVDPGTPVFTTLEVSPPSVTLFSRFPGNAITLVVTARDQTGQAMAGVGTPTFTLASPGVVTVGANGTVTAVALGAASVTASLMVGGIAKSASVAVLVRDASSAAAVSVTGNNGGAPVWIPRDVDISSGGVVSWSIPGDGPLRHNVVFDGDAIAAIQDLGPGEPAVSRSFPVAGTFSYRCTGHPSTMFGTVIVH
jgi:plastocyanin